MSPDDANRIVAIDDEPALLRVVHMKLSGAGYDVFTAEDGQEGWQAILEHRPGLVIADYSMPFMDGVELCRKMLQHTATAQTPVLMFTSHWHKIAPDCLALSNVAGVIEKPFSPRELLARVDAILRPAPVPPAS